MHKKVYVVIVILVLTSLACYSDNSLGLFQLTATSPPPTPIPPVSLGQSNLQPGDLALAVSPSRLKLDITNNPEPLRPDLSNRAPQSCSHNTVLRVLYSGQQENGIIYHLVDCSGVVGWATEDTLLGPLTLLEGDRALTTEEGVNETGAYKINANDPPYDSAGSGFQQQFDCKVNETVDVVGIVGFVSGDLYYKIRCQNPLNPIAQNVGWITPDALFGPVRFRNGETGLVPREVDAVALMDKPQGTEVVGTCESGEILNITDQPVQRIGDDLFYEVVCDAGTGWVDQKFLVGPVRFPVDTQVMVTTPFQVAPPSATEETITETATPDLAAPTEEPLPAVTTTVALTSSPEPLTFENQVGECEDTTLTVVQDIAGVNEEVYSQIECKGVVGWLNADRLYGPAQYAVGDTVMLGEKAVVGFSQQGVYLSINIFDIQGNSGGSSVIAGECDYTLGSHEPVEAALQDVDYYRDSRGEIVGIFYLATCLDQDGNEITGWINQTRIGES